MAQPTAQALPVDRQESSPHPRWHLSMLVVRVSLAVAFLSAVADRFGLWGAPGAAGVAWGDWAHFEDYTARLNWFLPHAVVPLVAWLATGAEVVLGIMLLAGIRVRIAAYASAALLLAFAITMGVALGPKAPLDYSVLTAAGGALLLGAAAERDQGQAQP